MRCLTQLIGVGLLICNGITFPLAAQDRLSIDHHAVKEIDQARLKAVAFGSAGVYTISMVGLYSLWYSDFEQSEFHSFDDSEEWLQVDKFGHAFSAYYLSRVNAGLYRWSGIDRRKAAYIGSASSLIFMSTIEVFDGFSEEWGFSWSDMAFNGAGIGLFLAQDLAWKEQRFTLKFSYHPTSFAELNPEQLGANFSESLFKDYNGQTYWLSGNVHSFLPESSRFPRWLNVAFGYGAEGMISALPDEEGEDLNGSSRYRQYYFSLDLDLSKMKTKKAWLRSVFEVLNVIKIPAPTIEFRSNGKWLLHGFYF